MPEENSSSQVTAQDIENAPSTVPATIGDTQVSRDDIFTKFVEVSDENSDLKLENEQLRAGRKTSDILDDLIKPYAKRTFVFMCAYCSVVGITLILHGFDGVKFSLPETVLTFLVGSTATTVIGLVGMVLTGIFLGARPKKD